jgi:hypothetical protein
MPALALISEIYIEFLGFRKILAFDMAQDPV